MGTFGSRFGKRFGGKSVTTVGGSSGGTIKKSIGHQLTDLGPRPHFLISGESISQIVIRPPGLSYSKVTIQLRNESTARLKIPIGGQSVSDILYPVSNESTGKLVVSTTNASVGAIATSHLISMAVNEINNNNKALNETIAAKSDNLADILKAMTYLNMLDTLDDD